MAGHLTLLPYPVLALAPEDTVFAMWTMGMDLLFVSEGVRIEAERLAGVSGRMAGGGAAAPLDVGGGAAAPTDARGGATPPQGDGTGGV